MKHPLNNPLFEIAPGLLRVVCGLSPQKKSGRCPSVRTDAGGDPFGSMFFPGSGRRAHITTEPTLPLRTSRGSLSIWDQISTVSRILGMSHPEMSDDPLAVTTAGIVLTNVTHLCKHDELHQLLDFAQDTGPSVEREPHVAKKAMHSDREMKNKRVG